MDDVRPATHPVEGYLHLLDLVLREDSIETALARGARALAAEANADVAALFVIEGSECVLQAWHPDEPAVRERWQTSFRAAADQACGRGPGPGHGGDAPNGHEALRVLPLVAAGRTIGAVCFSGGPGAAPGASGPPPRPRPR